MVFSLYLIANSIELSNQHRDTNIEFKLGLMTLHKYLARHVYLRCRFAETLLSRVILLHVKRQHLPIVGSSLFEENKPTFIITSLQYRQEIADINFTQITYT